jgi:transcriptional regulator with GAF, ATPase, and Fis domain
MDIEIKEFFQEATLRICGSLETEEFLEDSYRYLSAIMPIGQMALSYYNPETGQQTILAEVSGKGSHLVKQRLVQPVTVRPYSSRPGLETLIIERAEHHPTAQAWIAAGRLDKNDSLMVLRVFVRSDIIGTVVFVAPKGGKYTREHVNLVSLLRKPFAIALANSARYQELMELKELLAEDYRELQSDYIQSVGRDIVGARFGLKNVMDMVRQVAPLNSPVLLLGETGTGKELIAAAIHDLSPRRENPFIKVNCGAIPESLMDSELFGHEKGAFTGALKKKRGRFERADGGTIFLDEIGELKPEVQVRLLRVLQENEIERVGGTDPVKVDIRVIAATHRDLEKMVKQDRFRQDLYFRLKVFPVNIPPLRKRRGDIPSLVDHFITKKCRSLGLKTKPEPASGAMDHLMAYDWPGNVRELENEVERAMILSRGRPLNFANDELKADLSHCSPPTDRMDDTRFSKRPELQTLDRVIADHIVKALKMTDGQVGGKAGAAERLGLNPSTLRKKMRKLGIPFGKAAGSNYKM